MNCSPIKCAVWLLLGLLLVGCDSKEGTAPEHGKGDGHDHGAESPSGASFKAGKGVSVTEETGKIIGLQVAEVQEQKLAREIRFTAQVYGGTGRREAGMVKAAGFLSQTQAAFIRPGEAVRLAAQAGGTVTGAVIAVHPALALGDAEVDLALSGGDAAFLPGEFVTATITQPRERAVMVVPRAALLRTSEGQFVYAVNGPAYLRTAVKAGAVAGDLVEITDGLLAGDAVVTAPVETLWLIELRATKGGGHSH